MGLPKLGIEKSSTQNVEQGTKKSVNNTVEGNISHTDHVIQKCIEKGIQIDIHEPVGEKEEKKEREDLNNVIDSLSIDHSLRTLRDVFTYKTIHGVYLLADRQQLTQVKQDIEMLISNEKSVYLEYDSIEALPKIIKINHFSGQKVSELYSAILQRLIEIKSSGGNQNGGVKPIESVIQTLYDFGRQIESYKLYKNNPNVKNKLDTKVGNMLDSLYQIGDFNFVIHLMNPLYAVSACNGKKVDLEMKISAIMKFFEDTPFTLIITQVDLPEDIQNGVKPQTWGEEMKEVTLDLPTKEKYKKEIITTFNSVRNKKISAGFLGEVGENEKYLDELSSIASGLYLPSLREHITKYSMKNESFDTKDFRDTFYSYKIEAIKNIKSGALEIIDINMGFDSIGGLDGLKEDLGNLGALIVESSGELKKTYMFTGIPGSGKSMISKAISAEFEKITGEKWIGVRFNISKVLDKYVGNTEKNFAEIVKILDSLIDSMRGRMVLWIDEIEKALPRSESSYSDRLKGEMLTALEDKWGKKLLVVCTVNDHFKLDPELVSRFAKKYFFDNPTSEGRKKIIEVKSKQYGYILDDENIEKIVKVTEGFVGREFDDLFSRIYERMSLIKKKLGRENIVPNRELFLKEIEIIKPTIQSNTQKEKIERYRQLEGKYLNPESMTNTLNHDNKREEEDLSRYITIIK